MRETVAAKLIAGLGALGVDCIFATPGSEFIPIIEAYPRLRSAGLKTPEPVTLPHENLAATMAHGYFLASRKPQAVMAHVTVGAANSLLALIGAARMDVPIFFMSGRTPITQTGADGCRDRFVHWAQESYDQGAMTREFTKWDYELRRGEMLNDVLERAWSLMASAPSRPIHLILPRELLVEETDGPLVADTPPKVSPTGIGNSTRVELARQLQASQRPLLITSRSGLDPATAAALEQAAAIHGISVLCPQAQAMNVRTSADCFIGYQSSRAVKEADLILVLDTDVPWLPNSVQPAESAIVIHAGPEPLFDRIPLRSFRSHLYLSCASEEFLRTLVEIPPGDQKTSRTEWRSQLRQDFLRDREIRSARAIGGDLTVDHVAKALNEVTGPNTVVFNELSLAPELLTLDHAGGYFRSGSASSLGWALGAAIGFKMAKPESLPICVVGDGVYFLSNPLAAHWASGKYQAPILTLILNNGGMPSIHKDKTFTDLSPPLNFAAIAQSTGCFAARPSAMDELQIALKDGIDNLQLGRQGVIDVQVR